MANKMRKFLAWIMVLTLLTGQLALPAAADSNESSEETMNVTVDVSTALPEAPAAESQVPAASDGVSVTVEESVTTSTPDPSDGVIEESTSTTTTWSGSEGDPSTGSETTTTGTETTTTVTGTDDYSGQTLYEGGTTSGSETSVTTTAEEVVESWTEEDNVDKEIYTEHEGSLTQQGIETTSEETTTTETGEWINVEEEPVEGEFVVTNTKESSATETAVLGEEVLPEGGIDIGLTLDEEASNPENDTYIFTGTGAGEIIDLENIPDGATLVKDEDGKVIGYTQSTTQETITDTAVVDGKEQKDEANSSADTTGATSTVTPDLEAVANKLHVTINDNTQITEQTDDDGNVTAYVITNTAESEETLSPDDEVAIPEAGTFTQTDGDIKTVSVEETQDADGNRVIRITEVITDANGQEKSREEITQTIIDSAPMEPAEPVTNYILPQKPEGSTSTDNGITTTVTVTELTDDAGNVIGYKSTTVKTDANGAELFREENDLYGIEETITETVDVTNPQTSGGRTVKTTTVETSRVTAEETVYEDIAAYTRVSNIVHDMEVSNTEEMVQIIDGKLYYIYTGSVTVSEGAEHGDVSMMNPVTPMESLMTEAGKWVWNGRGYTWVSDLDLVEGGQGLEGVSSDAPDEGFKYIGSGVDTALNINKGYGNNKERSLVNQFRLISEDDKVYYAMCIDFNTSIEGGHLYDIEDIRDATYLQQSGNEDISAADKIRSVALNGYWGTENGVGSMDDVQTFLTAYLTEQTDMSDDEIKNVVDSLTPGQAQAATQAALWMFGNKDGNKAVNTSDLVTGNDSTDETMVKYLFDALLDTANDSEAELEDDEGVEFLDAEDISATAIVVKEKVASADDAGNSTGKNVYNTDLNFTLGIEPTKLFGDLKVTVYDNDGKSIKTVVLATKDTTIIGLQPDDNGMYTIKDIEIAEGVSVNLNLHGTQNLGTGVYIYTSLDGSFNDSQTLVTLATGSRKVDLDIEMTLDVQEPTLERTITTETTYGKRTDTQEQTRTDKITRKSTTTTNEWSEVETAVVESEKIYTSDVTLTQVKTTETKSERSWEFSWLKFFDPEIDELDDDIPVGDGDPGEDTGVRDEGTIIRDEDVPLAAAPKTGDISALWAVISLVSLTGAAVVAWKKEED